MKNQIVNELYSHYWRDQYELENIFEKNKFFYKATKIESVLHDDLKYNPFDLSWKQDMWDMNLVTVPNKGEGERIYLFAKIHTDHVYVSSERLTFKRYYPDGNIPTRKSKRRKVAVTNTLNKSVKNGCQIGTIARITGLDFDLVLSQMKKMGWDGDEDGEKTGTINTLADGRKEKRWDIMLAKVGLKMTKVWTKKYKFVSSPENKTETLLDAKKGMTVKTAAKHLKKGTYVVDVKGHVLCIIDGEIHDSWNSSVHHVLNIYKIEKE